MTTTGTSNGLVKEPPPEAGAAKKWSPSDLIAWSRTERVRRESAARTLKPGSWAVLVDDADEKGIGERVVLVCKRAGNDAQVQRIVAPGSSSTVSASKLKPVPALGDLVETDAGVGVAVFPLLSAAGSIAAFVPRWGADGQPDVVEVSVPRPPPTRRPPPPTETHVHVNQVHGVEASDGYFVRYENGDGTVGPCLTAETFAELSASVDPCLPRSQNHNRSVLILDTWSVPVRNAVLCDFAGGATLWIWTDCLTKNNVGGGKTVVEWQLSPTWGHHPATEKIHRLGDGAAKAALIAATANHQLADHGPLASLNPPVNQAALSAAGDDMPENLIPILCAAERPRRDDIYILEEDYHDRLELAAKQIRDEWTQTDRDRVDLDDALGDLLAEGTNPGGYVVRTVGETELPDGSVVHTVRAQPIGYKNGERVRLVVGLLKPASSTAVARRGEDEQGQGSLARVGGAVARATKEAGGFALGAAKDVAVGAKDFAVDAVTRKGTAIAREVAQDAAVGGAHMVRRGIGAAAEEMLGKEKGSIAEHPMFRHGFDFASVGALRVAGKALSKVAPGLAKTLSAGADTLEQGVDQQQARAVVDTVKPLASAGFMALAQAAVARVMPALAAPTQPAPAIPETTPEPSPKPTRKRKTKPKTEEKT